uniref:Uncharacterized protein n=1 Tax=Anguilla anguilla TaxID=7936 RepID=A0A0E9XFU3_ANGAN
MNTNAANLSVFNSQQTTGTTHTVLAQLWPN